MDLRQKMTVAFERAFPVANVKLKDDDGVYGVVVSKSFYGVSALDRQRIIHHALRDAPVKFTKAEKRRILAIAPLTPAEFTALGNGESE